MDANLWCLFAPFAKIGGIADGDPSWIEHFDTYW